MKFLFSTFVLLYACLSFSQRVDWSIYDFPLQIELDSSVQTNYSFIDLKKNHFEFKTASSPSFERFYRLFRQIQEKDSGKLNVYHIGGSHIQADAYSNVVRERLQSYSRNSGERGLIFPHNLAGSNNPGNYRISSPNKFEGKRIVGTSGKEIDLGLMGAAIVNSDDSVVNLVFRYRNANQQPCFNEVTFLRNKGEWTYDLNFGNDEILIESIKHIDSLGYTKVKFAEFLDSLDIQFNSRLRRNELELYGLGLHNSVDAGISYTSIGINGAGLYSYLAAPNFKEQLQLYPPDLFIFSVGTNDANVPYEKFNPQLYKSNLEKLMQIVLAANPNCALLLTVPNDAYYKKKLLNRNIAREREVIMELTEQYQMAVWDFYGVMGELGSSKTWMNNGLMGSDLVHFTSRGYQLKGQLLMDAFLKFFKQFEQLQ